MTRSRNRPEPKLRPAHPLVARPARERLRVSEVFHSIQGESRWAGWPCTFVRLTGCQMRCRWCDTEYAFYEGDWQSVAGVLEQVEGFDCRLVEVTGGEPLLQPGALALMERLCELGYQVLLETGGGLDIGRVDARVHRIVDVKCPGSGESAANRLENLELLTPRDELKMVLASRDDYEWARTLLAEHQPIRCPVTFSPVAGELELADLAAWVLADGVEVRLQGQLHKLMWGDQRGR